jgi:hypothetical protein
VIDIAGITPIISMHVTSNSSNRTGKARAQILSNFSTVPFLFILLRATITEAYFCRRVLRSRFSGNKMGIKTGKKVTILDMNVRKERSYTGALSSE